MKYYRNLLVASTLLWAASCGTISNTTSPYFSYETEYRGTSLDGVMQLTAWGKGSTRKEAITQAKRQAVHDILFKGITQGNTATTSLPLVIDPHARRIHEDYFQDFFSSEGFYSSCVKVHHPYHTSIRKYKNNEDKLYRVYVDVNRAALKRKLIEDKIINKETR